MFKLKNDLRYSFLLPRLHFSLIRSRRCRCSNLGSWSVVLEVGLAQERTVCLLRSTVRHWISSAISHFVRCGRISNCARCTWAHFRLRHTSTVAFPRKSMRWRRMFECEIFNKSRSKSKWLGFDFGQRLWISLERKAIRSRKVKKTKPSVMKHSATLIRKSTRSNWINIWHRLPIHWFSNKKRRYVFYIGRTAFADFSVFSALGVFLDEQWWLGKDWFPRSQPRWLIPIIFVYVWQHKPVLMWKNSFTVISVEPNRT